MTREPTALLLTAFLIAFVSTRTYTRLARVHGRGSASANGVHVHHTVALHRHERVDHIVGGAPTRHATFVPATQMLAGRLGPRAGR